MVKDKKRSLLRSSRFQDGLFVCLCSGGLLAYALYHQHVDRNVTGWKTSPFLFPVLLAGLGLLLSGFLFYDALRGGTENRQPQRSGNRWAPLVLTAAAVLYCALLPVLHFLPATALFLSALFLWLGERRPLRAVPLALAVTGLVYAVFALALRVRLP